MNAKTTKGMVPISMPAGWIKDEQGRWRRETLAGDGAATVDYHGMAPADIDRLALEAVTVI